jgi:hypothetical protein
MAFITDTQAHHIAHASTSRLERAKAEAKSQAARLGALAAGGAAGFGISFLNVRLGGTQTVPYLIAGKVPLDLAAAGAGAVALVLCRKAHHLPFIAGAAGGAMGVLGARYGATLEPQISAQLAAVLPGSAPAPSVAGFGRPKIGMANHGMLPRHGRPHSAYGTASNPYLAVAR